MTVIVMLIVMTFASSGWSQSWDRFRGPNGSGVSESTGMPVEFGISKNLVWRQEVPFGRSSPILLKDRVVVTASEEGKLITLCMDRLTGKLLWKQELDRDRTQKVYKGNDTATPTPSTDGSNIYVFFPDFGLISYDQNGKERWRMKLGPFDSFYGVSSSPIVHGNTLIQVCDQNSGSFIVAVDKDTGRVRWRTERKWATTEAYSTPIVWTPENGKSQLIVSGTHRLDAYAMDSGENIWWVGQQGTYPIATPAIDNDVIFAAFTGSDKPAYEPWKVMVERLDSDKDGKISPEELSADPMWSDHFGFGDQNHDNFITAAEYEEILRQSVSEHGLVAVRAGGEGDQTKEHLIWRYKKAYSDITSPLIYRVCCTPLKMAALSQALIRRPGKCGKPGG